MIVDFLEVINDAIEANDKLMYMCIDEYGEEHKSVTHYAAKIEAYQEMREALLQLVN